MSDAVGAETVELMLFEVAGVRYGAELAQVRSVTTPDPTLECARPLGQPLGTRRAIAFSPEPGVLRHLAVDRVLGVKTVPLRSLRRLPAAAAAPPPTIGAWLDGDRAVLLVDLHTIPPNAPNPETAHGP